MCICNFILIISLASVENYFFSTKAPIQVQMPALSPTMEEGTIIKWLIAEGRSLPPTSHTYTFVIDVYTFGIECVFGNQTPLHLLISCFCHPYVFRRQVGGW